MSDRDLPKHLQNVDPEEIDWKNKPESYWKDVLTDEQFNITRDHGTEPPFTGRFNAHKEDGVFLCSNCGNQLFSSDTKYESGSGWPSFYDVLQSSSLTLKEDLSHGMRRVEILCQRCNAHIGHVFDDGPKPTGKRYCTNSASLLFKSRQK